MRRLLAAACALAASMLLAACSGAPDGSAQQITRAVLLEPGMAAREVTLPDAWERSAPTRDGSVRYRIVLPDDALQSRPAALFVRRAGQVLRVTLNGVPIAAIGELRRPLQEAPVEPLLIALPGAVLQPSANWLDLEVHGEPRREAGLSAVWVGPMERLAPLYQATAREQVHGAFAVSAAAVVMGALALLLAWRARRFAYACFGAASLLWAWRVSAFLAGDPGDWAPLMTIVFQASYAWFVVLMSLYALSTVGSDTPLARRALASWALAALLLTIVGWRWNLPALRTVVLAGNLAVLVGLGVALVGAALRQRTQAALLLCVAAAISLAVGLRDFWVFRVVHDYGALAWSRYTILVLLAVLAWTLVDEFTRSSLALRALNRDLRERVAEKERELHSAFEGRRLQERDEAARAERDRILREMHDGLGGRLVAALALTQQARGNGGNGNHAGKDAIAEAAADDAQGSPVNGNETLSELKLTLDDCLVELRLALDSLESDRRPLIEALGELRFRVEPSLRAAGVRLVWQPDDALTELSLSAGDTLQVLRIVREALTNVIKHAQASVVWLQLEPLQGEGGRVGLRLRVVDNGVQSRVDTERGEVLPLFVPATMSRGRGLANMERRAQAIGALLTSGPREEGWAVTLEIAPRAAG
ncbi:sensor histidine kinase [Caldimonas sp. KR1-144]|uniref:sensor histidine kinase n=1 Tax=Caldimonas sp. KR1-144 TaxID=3400911 RepID=UPI003C0D47B0